MLQTLNPYPSTAKTAEIMARYRPIAPRPHTSSLSLNGIGGGSEGEGDHGSPVISQSPYLRNVWPHLQSRSTRTRKRGRTSLGPPPTTSTKRPKSTLLQGLRTTTTTTLVTLPLLPMLSTPHDDHMQQKTDHHVIYDLNKVHAEEKDFLGQLTKPLNVVISPRPIRLVSSYVTIRKVQDDDHDHGDADVVTKNKDEEEVEKELEAQVLPAFVSDSKNNVRLVNSAYKKMVGQPECAWLESTTGDACKSICGQVVLSFSDDDAADQDSTSGSFSCWATIEWGGVNGKKKKMNAFGEAMRISCESKDYKFAWCFKCVDQDSEFAKCEKMMNPTRNLSM